MLKSLARLRSHEARSRTERDEWERTVQLDLVLCPCGGRGKQVPAIIDLHEACPENFEARLKDGDVSYYLKRFAAWDAWPLMSIHQCTGGRWRRRV